MFQQRLKKASMSDQYLVCLVNNDGIIRELFYHVEIFNGGWGKTSSVSFMIVTPEKIKQSKYDSALRGSEIVHSLSQSILTSVSQK